MPLHPRIRGFANPKPLSDWLRPLLPAESFASWGVKPGTKNLHDPWLETSQGETSLSGESFTPEEDEHGFPAEKTMDIKRVTDAIDRCDPSQARSGLRFFVWAGLQRGYRHSPYAYERACKSLDITGNPKLIRDHVEACVSERRFVSFKAFKVVLNLCREAGLADESLWILRKMSELGLRGDSTTYSAVIRLLCRKGDMDGAEGLMREMTTGLGGIRPDMAALVEMVGGFCRAGRFAEARRVLDVAGDQGCSSNTVLYSSLVNGLCKSGETDAALDLLGEMERGREEIRPNVVTYTCVVQGFCARGRTSEAMEILDRMESRGCSPNHVTAGCLIERFAEEGRVEDVYGLIDRVVGMGGVSYEKCFSVFVVVLKRTGRFEEAEKVFRSMIGGGLRPDGLASSVVMKEVCSAGRFSDGYWLCVEIDKIEGLTSVDSGVLSVLLAGLYQKECLAEAAELAELMLKRGIQTKGSYAKSIMKNLTKSQVI